MKIEQLFDYQTINTAENQDNWEKTFKVNNYANRMPSIVD